jgi:predicted short-subunit dehydrogenase-like oxidoreductase (DUF2520 family)
MPSPKTKSKPVKKPSVSIIGTGRLGIAIGMALDAAGYRIDSLVGRRRSQVRKAAALLDVRCEILIAKELDKFRPADVVLVAVPDDRISEVADGLEKNETQSRPTVLHTSGALSSAVFARLSKKGWHTGSIHPLVSISDSVSGVALLKKACWCVEGEGVAVRFARRAVADIGGQSFSIDSKSKPLYHAAAVMSSGNVTALFDVALDMLERCGLSRSKAQKILLPLLESTTANLERFDPARALTGSFARGDMATVKMHLAALSEEDMYEALMLYRLLGRHSLKLAEDKIPAKVATAIKKRLKLE